MDNRKNRSSRTVEDHLDGGNDEKCTVVLKSPKEEKLIVCDVCGYANPPYTAICKKCSNYLDN